MKKVKKIMDYDLPTKPKFKFGKPFQQEIKPETRDKIVIGTIALAMFVMFLGLILNGE